MGEATVRRFLLWAMMGLIIPGAFLAFIARFDRMVPYWVDHLPRPWEANVVEVLFWIQVAYVGVGIWSFWQRRYAALAVAVVHIVLAGCLGLVAVMSISGVWL
jgi:hypothetical protein